MTTFFYFGVGIFNFHVNKVVYGTKIISNTKTCSKKQCQ